MYRLLLASFACFAVGCGAVFVGQDSAEASAKDFLRAHAYDHDSVTFAKVESVQPADGPIFVRAKGTWKVASGDAKQFDILLAKDKQDGRWSETPNLFGDTWKAGVKHHNFNPPPSPKDSPIGGTPTPADAIP